MTTDVQEPIPTVRRIPFEFPDDVEPAWHPTHREWSHMINGASLTMPYLEPFLIATLREAAAEISDPRLLEEVAAFVAQEGQHFRVHRRYNENLKRNGYPTLAAIEEAMKESYKRISANRSLAFRLGYSAGFESMTLGVTGWLANDRVNLFAGADTRVVSFVLWHMVEEVEHKRVAFDTYQHAIGRYGQRALGVLTGSGHVFWWSRKACIEMLKTDGLWRNPRSRLRLWRRTAAFFAAILPGMFKACLPGHDPRHVDDPDWVVEWIERFDPEAPALLDTNHPDIPVPYSAQSGSAT